MSTDQSKLIQGLLVRWQQGDEPARAELIHCAYERLRRLAAVILNESFPRLKDAPALLQTTDVANDAALGVYRMLDEIRPATARDFFRLAAQRIRWLLLDQAKKVAHARQHAQENLPPRDQPGENDSSVALGALYRQIEELPEMEREVVDLIYFHGLTQVEAADLLGVAERSVRRYWTAARVKLYQGLKELMRRPPRPSSASDALSASISGESAEKNPSRGG